MSPINIHEFEASCGVGMKFRHRPQVEYIDVATPPGNTDVERNRFESNVFLHRWLRIIREVWLENVVSKPEVRQR